MNEKKLLITDLVGNDTPEKILKAALKNVEFAEFPIDAITASLNRAEAMCAFIIGDLSSDASPMSFKAICDAVWAIQGACEAAHALAVAGHLHVVKGELK